MPAIYVTKAADPFVGQIVVRRQPQQIGEVIWVGERFAIVSMRGSIRFSPKIGQAIAPRDLVVLS